MGISYLGKDSRPGLRIYTSVHVKNECCVMRLCVSPAIEGGVALIFMKRNLG